MTAVEQSPPDKSVLTYSALNTFRNCPRKYKHRYLDCLRPREKPDALSFGSVIHGAIELWYRSQADVNRLWSVLNYIDQQFPMRVGDENQKAAWHLARALFTSYAAHYPSEDFEIVEVEKSFTGEIRNPDTNRPSQTFVMAGKADAIVKRPAGMYLLEHKTAASIDANYLDKLWTDTQIALYSFYLRQLGYLIHAADLQLSGSPTLPVAGDRIRETQGDKTFVYEVMAPGNEPHYRYSDTFRKLLRIHSKYVASEDI